jgi:predicted nucleic acid-binding protein
MIPADAIVVDTDVMIDHMEGVRRLVPDGRRVVYSVITRTELLAGARDSEAVRTFLGAFVEVPVTREIAEEAGRIRRDHRTPLADAFIAATAISVGASLLTRNRKDFHRINGLTLAT